MVASASEVYGLVKTKMSYKVTPPDLRNSKSYELFKKELDIWEITTPVPEEKRGAVIAALLPNDCKLKKDLKDKFFETVDVGELASKEGLKIVKKFLAAIDEASELGILPRKNSSLTSPRIFFLQILEFRG